MCSPLQRLPINWLGFLQLKTLHASHLVLIYMAKAQTVNYLTLILKVKALRVIPTFTLGLSLQIVSHSAAADTLCAPW